MPRSHEDTLHEPDRRLLCLIGVGVALFAVYGSLLPFDFREGELTLAIADLLSTSTWPPRVESLGDLIANVLLFVPIGFCFIGALQGSRQTSRSASLMVIGASVLFSFGLELAQEFLRWRTATMTDVQAETIGTMSGIGLWSWRGPAWAAWASGHLARIDRSPATRRLTFYALLYAFALLFPLDVTIRPWDIAEKFHDGRLIQASLGGDVWQAHVILRLVLAVLLATPLGVLAVLGWTRDRQPRPLLPALALGAGGVVGLAIAQVFVFSRPTDLVAMLTGIGGVGLGSAAAVIMTPAWKHSRSLST